ncbi:protein DCL, chloroplastic isoform X2 [Ananas comosus]|uniref:Protein DCL, chloroplastic isoform X2 n=1 Tax=Ananas comosus TaxID=4615 RepID=A0A6P5GCC3_ANACO|nr:protein DCL, chloroplastic isoform X2 [Ananas comosus]
MAFAAALLLARGAPLLLLRWSARAPRAGAGAAALGAARRHLSALSTADDLPPPAPPPHVDGGVGAPLGAKGPAPPSLSKAWADEPGFRRWKDKEAEILSDIGPIIALTKNILHSNRYRDGEHLSAEDQKAVVEKLLAYHPHSEDKIGCGLNSVMVDRHPQFRYSRCLFVVRNDGGWIDFSYQKCLRAYIREKYPSHAERFIREHFKRN